MIIPADKNGPKGISDLIVRLFQNIGKPKCGISFLRESASSEKTAPIQKAKTTADTPSANPRKNPKTAMYLTSPKPNQRPLEIRKMRRNGRVRTRAEIRECIMEYVLSIMERKDKIKKKIRKESGMMKCLRS